MPSIWNLNWYNLQGGPWLPLGAAGIQFSSINAPQGQEMHPRSSTASVKRKRSIKADLAIHGQVLGSAHVQLSHTHPRTHPPTQHTHRHTHTQTYTHRHTHTHKRWTSVDVRIRPVFPDLVTYGMSYVRKYITINVVMYS